MFDGLSGTLGRGLLALSMLAYGAGVQSGEIVVGGSPKVKSNTSVSSSGSEASRQREAARDYRKGQVATEVLVLPEVVDEDGLLSPREEVDFAGDNVDRARAARQGGSGQGSGVSVLGSDSGRVVTDESPSAQSARKNREKATDYRKGGTTGAMAVSGNDALPVVDCSNVENVAGRIGDDTQSGSVIMLMQGRNQIKVRCR